LPNATPAQTDLPFNTAAEIAASASSSRFAIALLMTNSLISAQSGCPINVCPAAKNWTSTALRNSCVFITTMRILDGADPSVHTLRIAKR
jgi:hypothetical protein